jgi:hypothetical protein
MYKRQHELTQRRISTLSLSDQMTKPVDVGADRSEIMQSIKVAISAETKRLTRIDANIKKWLDFQAKSRERKKELKSKLKLYQRPKGSPGEIQDAFMDAARKVLSKEMFDEVMDATHDELESR